MKKTRFKIFELLLSIIILVCIVSYFICTAGFLQKSRVAKIHEALHLYFLRNGEYPERLNVLAEQHYLTSLDTLGCFEYYRKPNKGEYFLCYTTDFGLRSNLSGTRYEYLSYAAKVERLIRGVREYYFMNGRYPASLAEYCQSVGSPMHERDDLLKKEIIKYEVSSDGLQAFINGEIVQK